MSGCVAGARTVLAGEVAADLGQLRLAQHPLQLLKQLALLAPDVAVQRLSQLHQLSSPVTVSQRTAASIRSRCRCAPAAALSISPVRGSPLPAAIRNAPSSTWKWERNPSSNCRTT